MGISSIDKATQNLVKWSARGEWEALQREACAAHFEPVIDSLDLPDDALDVLPDDTAGMLSVFILEDFFTARFGEHGERNVIDDYLKRRGWRESVPGRRYLAALRDSTVSLYEVVDIVPGRHMTVRDLIFGGAAVRVEEKLGSQAAALWDCLAARVVSVHGKNRFTGAVLHFRHELSQQLLTTFEKMAGELQREIRSDAGNRQAAPVTRVVAREVMVRTPLFARILSQFWIFDAVVQARAPAPELRNTDDEAMVFCEVRFPIEGDEARVAAVLDGIEGFEREEDGVARWRWFAAGFPLQRAARHRGGRPVAESSQNAIGTTSLGYAETRKGALVLSVNSRERAGRGQELLASRLGDLVGPALIAHQTPERALEEQSGQAPVCRGEGRIRQQQPLAVTGDGDQAALDLLERLALALVDERPAVNRSDVHLSCRSDSEPDCPRRSGWVGHGRRAGHPSSCEIGYEIDGDASERTVRREGRCCVTRPAVRRQAHRRSPPVRPVEHQGSELSQPAGAATQRPREGFSSAPREQHGRSP